MYDRNLLEIMERNSRLFAEITRASALYSNIQGIQPPSNLAELQRAIEASRGLWQNNQMLYSNTMPIKENVLSILATIQHTNPIAFQQSFDYLEKINPNLNTSLNNTLDDLDNQIHQHSIARTQYIHILEAIGADLLALIEAADKSADVQLLYPIFFLIVSLILYLKSTPEALLKQENTEN